MTCSELTTTACITYVNRKGDTYYLHEGRTKTGKPRYFVAKTPREGTLTVMPQGFEFSESINGVVSVRRINTSEARIPDSDVAILQDRINSHQHLRGYRADVVKGEIVVFEPERPLPVHRCPSDITGRIRYSPVLRFIRQEKEGRYSIHRMTYRGNGGWSWPLASGTLHELAQRFFPLVGTDKLFELW